MSISNYDHPSINYWDGSTITQLSPSGIGPSLYEGTIAWFGFDGNDYEIYYWDGSTTTQITDNGNDQDFYYDGAVSLYDGTLAWQAGNWNGSNYEIFYWDGGSLDYENGHETQNVPEPSTMLLLSFGLIGLAGFRRKV